MPKKQSKTDDVIQISREHWNILNWRVKKILIGNVKVIDKEGGEKKDDDTE